MLDTPESKILKDTVPLYNMISEYELLLNQLVYKIDKSTLNLDDDNNSDYDLLKKFVAVDKQITSDFPYKEYDNIYKSYSDLKNKLDTVDKELKENILMTLFNNYKKLSSLSKLSNKGVIVKDIPISSVISYSQILAKFTSKPSVTLIDQSIIDGGLSKQEQEQQMQDPSGWNFIWAGDDMIRRGNMVIQQQQEQIRLDALKEKEIKEENERKEQEQEEEKTRLAENNANANDSGVIFDGRHKEESETSKEAKTNEKEDQNPENNEDDFDLDLFSPDDF